MAQENFDSGPAAASETDWSILNKLFATDQRAFRHHMGVYRLDPLVFYAPTAHASGIREDKRRVLQVSQSEKYLLSSEMGLSMFRELAPLVGLGVEAGGVESSSGSLDRERTLRLEPDVVLVSAPRWEICWASVCFPSRWSLEGKLFRALADIHAVVPGLNRELGRNIEVFFARLVPGEGWGRANWGLSGSPARNQHPSLPFIPLTTETPPENVWVRIESQHLLKLPESGGIAFGIRILNFSLSEVATRCPDAAGGLKEQLRTMPAEAAAYKGIPTDFWWRL